VHLGPDSDPAPAARARPRPSGLDQTQRAAGIVSIAIMCSRLLGLVREVILGGLFGGSKWMDGFMVAFRTPNMLRDLFAEGALSTAFVTTFSQKLKT
jgi:putative peptidoglycan lipid II flippase